jgi:hypothetical protein
MSRTHSETISTILTQVEATTVFLNPQFRGHFISSLQLSSLRALFERSLTPEPTHEEVALDSLQGEIRALETQLKSLDLERQLVSGSDAVRVNQETGRIQSRLHRLRRAVVNFS